MGFWNGVKVLFGAGKTTDDIFDKDTGLLKQAGEWFGNLHHTTEERAEAAAKSFSQMCDGVASFVQSTLSENTVRSKTRRVVAIRWIGVELLLVLATAVAFPFSAGYAAFLWQIASSEMMVWGTLSVLAFFFGPYMIGNHMMSRKSPKEEG